MDKKLPAQKEIDVWELQTCGSGRTDFYQDTFEDGYKSGFLGKWSLHHH